MGELGAGWTPERLAAAVGRGKSTVQRWCATGLVPASRVASGRGCGNGGRFVIDEATAVAIVNGDYVFPVAA